MEGLNEALCCEPLQKEHGGTASVEVREGRQILEAENLK